MNISSFMGCLSNVTFKTDLTFRYYQLYIFYKNYFTVKCHASYKENKHNLTWNYSFSGTIVIL